MKQTKLANLQVSYLDRIQAIGLNIVLCPSCGAVVLCDLLESKYTCPYCLEENLSQESSDLLWTGYEDTIMPLKEKENPVIIPFKYNRISGEHTTCSLRENVTVGTMQCQICPFNKGTDIKYTYYKQCAEGTVECDEKSFMDTDKDTRRALILKVETEYLSRKKKR
ncbi:MAG: hypothetical protein EOM67_13755 [Spirochaetia bacterium]|nr:hypothetical protein [Spirochaetia bacterium]